MDGEAREKGSCYQGDAIASNLLSGPRTPSARVAQQRRSDESSHSGSAVCAQEPRLSQWAKRQVRASQKGILSPTRARLLERLGIKGLCTGDKEDWRGMFTELRKYQNNCNDVSVGYGWAINPRLGGWVHKQRWGERQSLAPCPMQFAVATLFERAKFLCSLSGTSSVHLVAGKH